jgi:Flp pilus assembly protein TadD
MKKVSILFLLVVVNMMVMAQKSNITSALNYLKESDFENAKKMIDEATTSESTKANAKAWLVKAIVYQAIGSPLPKDLPILNVRINDNDYPLNIGAANKLQATTPNALATSIEAYKKTTSLDAKYNKDEIAPLVQNMLFQSFNEGIKNFNDNNFKGSYDKFTNVSDLSSLDNGKLFFGDGQMDTIAAQAKLYRAYSADNIGSDDEALPLLEACMKNPITNNENLYLMTAEIYKKKNNMEKYLQMIQEGKAAYPKNNAFANEEINYLIQTGKTEELAAKFKEAIAADPTNAEKHFGLGNAYEKMAFGTGGKKPANSSELLEKAAASYYQAATLNPKNPDYQLNLGVIGFNKAKEMTDVMNKADDKTYNSMKPKRDELLTNSLPFLEKAVTLLEAGTMDEAGKATYKQVINGLIGAYGTLNKLDKVTEMQKKLKGL